jgi:hypothetical protein
LGGLRGMRGPLFFLVLRCFSLGVIKAGVNEWHELHCLLVKGLDAFKGLK